MTEKPTRLRITHTIIFETNNDDGGIKDLYEDLERAVDCIDLPSTPCKLTTMIERLGDEE